jgi:hypothetical protein
MLICSLKTDVSQTIPADGEYHLVRFPYGAGESYDPYNMHPELQPDDYEVTDWATDDRSGLVWPVVPGWGTLYALAYWDTGLYTEVRSRFVRDPLDLSTGYDSTCTEDDAATPGGQYRAKSWGMFVQVGTPLGFMVRHNGATPAALTLAEFKLVIEEL